VSNPANNGKLNRRALLLGAVFLVGGGAALTRFARHGAAGATHRAVFSPDQFALLEQVSEAMIPATDTPGAIGAGVPAFIGQLLADWAAPDTCAAMLGVLDSIEEQAWTRFGATFRALPGERRLELLKAFDERSIARQDPAYAKFKYLVLLAYYQSEVGATQELRYELVPGAWRACLPLAELGRASAI
jgi:hypothetical protein